MSRILLTKQAGIKKLISCLLVLLSLSVLMTGCSCSVNNNIGSNGTNGNGQEVDPEMRKKLFFLVAFVFNCNHEVPPPSDYAIPTPDELSNYTDFVLVIDKSEQVNYPEGVFVAWPTIYTERILWSVNFFAIYNSGADPTPYGLSYPITMTDVVENWESFNDFVFSLDESVRNDVMTPSHGYAESDEGWKPLP